MGFLILIKFNTPHVCSANFVLREQFSFETSLKMKTIEKFEAQKREGKVRSLKKESHKQQDTC